MSVLLACGGPSLQIEARGRRGEALTVPVTTTITDSDTGNAS